MIREIKVKSLYIPDGYVRVMLNSKDDFIKSVTPEKEEEDSSYFKEGNMLLALGDGIVFMYEETK